MKKDIKVNSKKIGPLWLFIVLLWGCSVTQNQDSTLRASFTCSPVVLNIGQAAQFTDTSTGSPTSWEWNFGDGGTSTAQNPNHSYTTAGYKTVTLTVRNSSGSNNASRILTVVTGLTASFAFSPALPAPGRAVAFTDTSTGSPTSWQWNFGDGGTSTAQNPSHTYAATGSYSVTLIAGNASGSDTTSRTIAVTALDILPADRLIDWSYAGVPGGIPNRTNIHTTLTSSATATQISNAIAACSSAGGGVVYLAAGTYNLTGSIQLGNAKGVTLRGAGAGQTVLNISGRIINSERTYYEAQGIPVSSGYTKGSTAIILASTPTANFAAGNIICISEDPSPDKWGTGIGVYYRIGFPAGSSVYNLTQTRCFRHMNRVVSVVGNTINLAAPIPLDFSPSLNVRAYPPGMTGGTSLCGLENMTVDAQNIVDTPIYFSSADRCWVKNVELKNVPGSDIGMIRFWQCFQCEIRRCYIHDATGYPNQTDGFATSFNYGSSNCLIVDCIVDRVADLCESNGAAACAYLYNYSRSTLRASIYSRGMTVSHGPHGLMLLAEGNILSTITNDGYHGSTSHVVAFRNHISGVNPEYSLSQRKLVNLCRGSYYHTLIGNILGDSSWTPSYYEYPYSGGSSIQSIYFIGFPAADSTMVPHTGVPVFANYSKYYGAILDTAAQYPDPDVSSTLLRHGNYDYYNHAVVWDDAIASRVIPNSLVYGSKPDFFGSLQWPPIGPDVSGLVSAIPAKARWDAYLISGNLADLFRD
jgi:PKD repeat protein